MVQQCREKSEINKAPVDISNAVVNSYRPGKLTSLEILTKLFVQEESSVLKLVLQGCNGDVVKAIEHILSARDCKHQNLQPLVLSSEQNKTITTPPSTTSFHHRKTASNKLFKPQFCQQSCRDYDKTSTAINTPVYWGPHHSPLSAIPRFPVRSISSNPYQRFGPQGEGPTFSKLKRLFSSKTCHAQFWRPYFTENDLHYRAPK